MQPELIASGVKSPSARPINPWVVAGTVTLATFMELLDTSIANVSLPNIAGGLGRSFDEVTWILTTYLVANAVTLPLSAWFSRVFGRKTYYMICVTLFTVSSFFCGIAPSLPIMLMSRVLQGAGGGGLAPVEQAILVDTFPPAQRASAFATYTIAIVTAPAVGPVLGGWITDNYSWRWIFFINIPVGILSLFLTNRFVFDPPSFNEERRTVRSASGKIQFDGVGIALIGIGSAALELFLDRGQIEDWFSSRFIVWMLVISIGCFGTGLVWEYKHVDPVMDVRLLWIRNFAVGNIFFFLFGFGLFASTTIIPEMLLSLYGYSAVDAGLVLGPGAFAITLLAPVAAMLLQTGIIKPRILLFLSVVAIGMSFIYASRFNLDTDFGHFSVARVLSGVGYAFFFVPLSVILYSQLSLAQNNRASSFSNFFRNWGGSFGVAFVTALSDQRQSFHQARVSASLVNSSAPGQDATIQLTHYFEIHGFSQSSSVLAASARIYGQLIVQTQLLAFMDCFFAIGVITLLVAPIAFIATNVRGNGDSTVPH